MGVIRIYLALVLWVFAACASKPSSQETMENTRASARPHPSAWGMESFYPNKKVNEKDPQQLEFFYKKCEFISHRPFPLQSEYDCEDPH